MQRKSQLSTKRREILLEIVDFIKKPETDFCANLTHKKIELIAKFANLQCLRIFFNKLAVSVAKDVISKENAFAFSTKLFSLQIQKATSSKRLNLFSKILLKGSFFDNNLILLITSRDELGLSLYDYASKNGKQDGIFRELTALLFESFKGMKIADEVLSAILIKAKNYIFQNQNNLAVHYFLRYLSNLVKENPSFSKLYIHMLSAPSQDNVRPIYSVIEHNYSSALQIYLKSLRACLEAKQLTSEVYFAQLTCAFVFAYQLDVALLKTVEMILNHFKEEVERNTFTSSATLDFLNNLIKDAKPSGSPKEKFIKEWSINLIRTQREKNIEKLYQVPSFYSVMPFHLFKEKNPGALYINLEEVVEKKECKEEVRCTS